MKQPIDHLLEIIKTRRSVREYRPEPVPDEHIRLILESARWSPSGDNSQPWEFLVIRDRETKEKIRAIYYECYKDGEKIYPHFQWGKRAFTMPWPHYSFLTIVPVIIAVLGDVEKRKIYPGRNEEIFCFSIAAAIQNMLLAAKALGLGSVWLTHGLAHRRLKDFMVEHLNVPSSYRLMSLIPIGYPAKPFDEWPTPIDLPPDHQIKMTYLDLTHRYAPNSRRPLESFVHFEKFRSTR